MSPLLSPLCQVGATLLLAAGITHCRRRHDLRQNIRAHGIFVSRNLASVAGGTLIVTEVSVGTALWVAFLGRHDDLYRLGAMLAATIFLIFAVYLTGALRRGAQGADCACGLGAIPVGYPAITRATVLLVISAWTALDQGPHTRSSLTAASADWTYVSTLVAMFVVGLLLAIFLPVSRTNLTRLMAEVSP